MKGYAYCRMHNTFPLDDEPCWACIRRFSGAFNPSDSIAAENQKHRKPCRIDKVTLCYQYPDDDCGCDPCDPCEVKRRTKCLD